MVTVEPESEMESLMLQTGYVVRHRAVVKHSAPARWKPSRKPLLIQSGSMAAMVMDERPGSPISPEGRAKWDTQSRVFVEDSEYAEPEEVAFSSRTTTAPDDARWELSLMGAEMNRAKAHARRLTLKREKEARTLKRAEMVQRQALTVTEVLRRNAAVLSRLPEDLLKSRGLSRRIADLSLLECVVQGCSVEAIQLATGYEAYQVRDALARARATRLWVETFAVAA
jgi:hypothetical protein